MTEQDSIKRQKVDKPKKKLIINAFTHGAATAWAHPDDRSRELTRSLEPWIELAQYAEKAKLHGIFIADHLTVFNANNDYEASAIQGHNIPRIDPSSIVPALAALTKNLGFGVTFSTVSEAPYLFARRLASLDHITKSRIGWNIVSSYLNTISDQLLNGEPFPEHDARYARTEEYVDVVQELILSSWREDALINDKQNKIFIKPERLREINYEGEYFKVKGPAITEPLKSGFPVVIQAGTSIKGKQLAARTAEIVYLDDRDKDTLKEKIDDIKRIAKNEFGRDPDSIKFLIASIPIIGRTHAEAEEKLYKLQAAKIEGTAETGFSGISGIDLTKYGDDDIVDIDLDSNNGLRTTVENVARVRHGKKLTKREIIINYGKRSASLFGSYVEVADEIERWVRDYGIDGLNLSGYIFPDGIKDITELLIPELQKRGIFHDDYEVPGGSFRENIKGEKGAIYFDEDHPSHDLKWTANESKEDFEIKIKKTHDKLSQIRKNLK
ncbi:hypothetical protein WICMUC_000977 [Wickerhamomyces mucosus]|uniref:Luciferase-like domain-containing protein n=1 Tax=Wickerhamomyces mucosus TaxID=1378264 RepID=A0A9P8PWG5_9ASCO|nr:hypothetical protein WICMUC_000977 [Wickerhamomyces mucosus]